MKKTKIILTTLIIMLAIILLNTSEVHASLQANPNTHCQKSNSAINWMKNFRKMEEQGEGMGLSETLNEDLTASSKRNNIDVHMMRTTEYGAIAILSASGYGNNQILQNSTIKTTTGNKTGVYFSGGNWEYTAGGLDGIIFPGVNKKYYDTYTVEKSSARVGDALGDKTNNGCMDWHSSYSRSWPRGDSCYFGRDGSGLFYYESWAGGITDSGSKCRGVAVCGQDL